MKRQGDILGYARVSTTDQDLSGQITRLKEAGAIRVFEDVVSGKQFDRPGLSALIDHARSGDSLAIIRLDRLGRSLKELLETVENLKDQDIGLISLEERIDTTSAAGELIFHVFGAIAHFERRLISERTKDGIQAARMKGKKTGEASPQSRNSLGSAKPSAGWNDRRTSLKTIGHSKINGLQIDQGNSGNIKVPTLFRLNGILSTNLPMGPNSSIASANPARLSAVVAPLCAWSVMIRSHPASVSASICRSRFCSSVDTRA